MADTTTTTTVDDSAERAAEVQQARDESIRTGEVAIDENAETPHLQEQSVEERLESARNDAVANHAAEHANDEHDYETTTSVDKPADSEA